MKKTACSLLILSLFLAIMVIPAFAWDGHRDRGDYRRPGGHYDYRDRNRDHHRDRDYYRHRNHRSWDRHHYRDRHYNDFWLGVTSGIILDSFLNYPPPRYEYYPPRPTCYAKECIDWRRDGYGNIYCYRERLVRVPCW